MSDKLKHSNMNLFEFASSIKDESEPDIRKVTTGDHSSTRLKSGDNDSWTFFAHTRPRREQRSRQRPAGRA
jgi:hypothetical protein